MAQLYQAIPVHFKDNVLTVATSQPQNVALQDEMRRFSGLRHPAGGRHRVRNQQGA